MANRLVGYFENWAQYRPAGNGQFFPAQIDPGLFTHINFAFGLVGFITWSVDPTATRTGSQRYTGDYSIQPVEWDDQATMYPALQALKSQNPGLKTLLSVGGWSMNSCDDTPNPGNPHPYGPYTCQLFSKMAADPEGRAQFIASAIAYAATYGFDGIDIDWEYPGYVGRGGGPDDLANFLALAQEFRAAAGPDFLLTMAAPAIVPTGLPQAYHDTPATYFGWLQQCSQYFDWLNVMSYDYHGAFDDPVKTGTGANAPLTRDSTPDGPFSVMQTVEAYLAAGIDPGKIVLGMPAYGRSYTVADPGQLASDHGPGQPFSAAGPAGPATQIPGVLAYYEILAKLAAGELTAAWHDATLTPYAYSAATGEWVSYDDETSLGYKASYLAANGLGGAMVFAIDDDDFANGFPLIKQVKSVLDNPGLRQPLPLDPPGFAPPPDNVKVPAAPHLNCLDSKIVGPYITAAWKKALKTPADPANLKWYTDGPNGDLTGLYGGLSDTIQPDPDKQPELTFDTDRLVYTSKPMTVDAEGSSFTVDNTNGNNPGGSHTLTFEHSTSTSTSTTITHSAKVDLAIDTKVTFPIDLGFTLTIGYGFMWSQSNTTTNGTVVTESVTTNVTPPSGKVYKAELIATVQAVKVPFTATIFVKGRSETWFGHQVQGHYNWSASAGDIFGWINQYGVAGDESAFYSNLGNGQGAFIVSGMLEYQNFVDFRSHVSDVTPAPDGAVTAAATGRPPEPGGQRIEITDP